MPTRRRPANCRSDSFGARRARPLTTGSVERAIDRFLTDATAEHFANGAGLKATIDVKEIYERYPEIFDRVLVGDLLADRSDPRTRRLAEFVVLEYLGFQVREL